MHMQILWEKSGAQMMQNITEEGTYDLIWNVNV